MIDSGALLQMDPVKQSSPEKSRLTRASLLSRLKNWEDETSWKEFFDIYRSVIYGMARKARLTEAEAEDVVQETLVSVANRIKGFKYDPAKGSFGAWLGKLTHWRIKDQFRRRMRELSQQQSAEGQTQAFERLPDERSLEAISNAYEQEWLARLKDIALRHTKEQASPRDFQIFQLYVLREWPVNKVTSALKVSRSQVYVAKHRVSKIFNNELTRLHKRASAQL